MGFSLIQRHCPPNPPLVSVVIPTHNRVRLLERAILSVLGQSFKDFELIVVDDGSDDSTQELLKRYAGRITVLVQPRKGVAAARNLGIRHSRGGLLAFLDSDDEWLPVKLERQVARFDPTDDFFICHTDEIWLKDGNEVPQQEKHRKQGGHFFERALELCLISPSSVMISRTLLDHVGLFDEQLPAAEDYDLWLRITAYYEVDFISEPLVVKHAGHKDQLSRTVPAIDRYRIRAIEKSLAHADLRQEYRQAAIRELARKCGIVAMGCERKSNWREAEQYRELARSYLNSDG